MAEPVYRRVVIKLSGEYLAGSQSFGIDQPTVDRIADELIAARQFGVEVAVVVGGGNIVRGVEVSSRGVSRPTGDTMGMLATMMNCLALEAAIERKGTPARTLSAFVMPEISELFTRSATHKYLAEGRIVLLGGGTGNPFFTTDTTPDAFAGHRRWLQGDGCDRIRACPGDVAAYHRILDRRAGFDRRDPARYRTWHDCRRLTCRAVSNRTAGDGGWFSSRRGERYANAWF